MDGLRAYNRKRMLFWGLGVSLAVLVMGHVCLAVSSGAMRVPVRTVWQIILAGGDRAALDVLGVRGSVVAVVWQIRLPRAVAGVLAGAGLAVAGAVFQPVLQNPLADPYTLGISSGAAFGASTAITVNLLWGLWLPVTGCALAGALITLGLVILIAKQGGGFVNSNLVIAGIIMSSILSSGMSFLKMLAGEQVGAIVYWLMGSLNAKSWGDVRLLAAVIVPGVAVAWIFSEDLNLMILGEKDAAGLGINVRRMRLVYLIVGALITSVCVAVCGIIGFVGLMIPHMLRFWLSMDNRVIVPLSAVSGALLLSVADNAARLISSGEIPVGVLTTLLGGPFFICLFVRRKERSI